MLSPITVYFICPDERPMNVEKSNCTAHTLRDSQVLPPLGCTSKIPGKSLFTCTIFDNWCRNLWKYTGSGRFTLVSMSH